MAWVTAENLIDRYSPAILGGLASDSGSVVPQASLATDERIIAALATAVGKVKASILQGGRYSIPQIDDMVDDSSATYDSDSAAFLADIICRVAFWLLWQRKPWSDQHENQRKQAEADSEAQLERLRKGTEIFNIGGAISSGVVDSTGITSVSTQYSYSASARGKFFPQSRRPF